MRPIIVLLMCANAAWAAGASTPASPRGDAAAGKKVFLAKCATCHGKDAKGSPAMAKMLKTEPADLDLTGAQTKGLSGPELAKIVADGRKKMPAFKAKLTPAQLSDVLAYVESLTTAKP